MSKPTRIPEQDRVFPEADASKAGGFLEVLGLSIKLVRVERGWSQEVLGMRAGLDRTYIGAIERGERNVGVCNIVQLARALGLSLSELVHRAETLKPRAQRRALPLP